MIDYTALTHNGAPRKKVTRDEFLRECAERSNTTVEHVLEYHDVAPCNCGELDCPGWRATYLLKNKRERKA